MGVYRGEASLSKHDGSTIMSSPDEVEERLFHDLRQRNELNEVFWCHIGRYAHAYDVVAAHAKATGAPLQILDAASGSGYGTYFLSRGGHHCTGVDLNPEAITFSRRVYGRRNCRFEQADVLHLPFANYSFDVGVSFETIEHLSKDDQTAFIGELQRVVKPRGLIIISAPVQPGGLTAPAHNPFHQHEPDPLQLIALVRQRFEQVETFGQLIATGQARQEVVVNPRQGAPEGQLSAPQDAAMRLSVLRRGRGVLRLAAERAFGRHHLTYPWLLKRVMGMLYRGYAVRPLNWKQDRATFLIVTAHAK